MRKLGVTVVVAAALLLTGCAGGGEPAGDASGPAAATPSAAPVTMAPEATASAAPAGADSSGYLEVMHAIWQGETPADEELIGAGQLVCDALDAGTEPTDIVAVQGESDDAQANNLKTVTAATQYLCPEYF